MSGPRVVFLDRDGTINVDHGYVHRTDDFHIYPDAAAAIKLLRELGFVIAVASNQSGIGRGLYSAADFWSLHAHLQRHLSSCGTTIDAVAFCPHTAGHDCTCRKPRRGLADQIEQVIGHPIDYTQSWTIGDKPTDVEFGCALGTKTALICSRYWIADQLELTADLVGNSLFEIAEMIAQAEKLT